MNKWSNQLVKITKVSRLWKTQSQSLVQIPNPIYANLQLQEVNNFVIKIAKCWATPTSDQEGPIYIISEFTINFMSHKLWPRNITSKLCKFSVSPKDAMQYTFIDNYEVVSSESSQASIISNCASDSAQFSIKSFAFGEDGQARVSEKLFLKLTRRRVGTSDRFCLCFFSKPTKPIELRGTKPLTDSKFLTFCNKTTLGSIRL